jgi:hypothetical protein
LIKFRDEYLGYDPDKPQLLKVVCLDIETTPILAWVWGLWDQNIPFDRIVQDWYILSVAWKWLDEDEGYVMGLSDFDGYTKGDKYEVGLVDHLFNILDEADIVVAHNGVKFDVKKINAKLLQYGYSKPSPFKIVDTLRIAQTNFAMTSNKLDYISRYTQGPGKEDTGGFETWVGCMNGDKDAWATLLKYNLVDTLELERVYLLLRGWDKSHPNIARNVPTGMIVCTTCGSDDLEPLGPAYTAVNSYQAYRCNGCGQHVRSRKSLKLKENQLVNAR